MNEIILKLIEQLNSSVFILFLILILVGIVLYKLGYWTHKFSSHNERVIKIEGLGDKVVSIETKIDMMYKFLNPNMPFKNSSPVRLTPVGEEIVKKINAQVIFDKYVSTLTTTVETLNPQNAYDIQEISFKVVKEHLLSLFNEEELLKVKNEAYERGLLVEDVVGIFGLFLRNHILKKKNIPISEVDKHDPRRI